MSLARIVVREEMYSRASHLNAQGAAHVVVARMPGLNGNEGLVRDNKDYRQLLGEYQRLYAAYEGLRISAGESEKRARKAEAALERMRRFSHDAKNYLAPIKGFAQLLIRNIKGGRFDEAKALGYLETIDGRVNEILELSLRTLEDDSADQAGQNPSGDYKFEELFMKRIIMEAVDELAGYSPDSAPVRVNGLYNSALSVYGDELKLKAALKNLIGNAIDAMPGGGEITMEARDIITISGESYVLVRVSDSGIGMSQDTLEKVFGERNFTSKGSKGHGIGVESVLMTVIGHKGWMEVESELGKGTSFYIYLPAATSEVARQLYAQVNCK